MSRQQWQDACELLINKGLLADTFDTLLSGDVDEELRLTEQEETP